MDGVMSVERSRNGDEIAIIIVEDSLPTPTEGFEAPSLFLLGSLSGFWADHLGPRSSLPILVVLLPIRLCIALCIGTLGLQRSSVLFLKLELTVLIIL